MSSYYIRVSSAALYADKGAGYFQDEGQISGKIEEEYYSDV